ncbi:MAG: signal peptidase II [archaeon]
MVKKNILLFLGLLILDQITKLIVSVTNASIDLKILSINFIHNTGAIWGFFQNSNMVFIWISLIAIGVLLYFQDKFSEKSLPFYTLLLAGVIGNLMDRIFRGYVVDFIDFKIWPVFNFADAFIVIGVIGLIIYTWKEN